MIEAQQNAGAENLPRRNRRRLRSHLIHSDIRLRLVLDDMLFALLAALAAIGILYYLSNREIGDTLFSAHHSIKETRELLNTGVKLERYDAADDRLLRHLFQNPQLRPAAARALSRPSSAQPQAAGAPDPSGLYLR